VCVYLGVSVEVVQVVSAYESTGCVVCRCTLGVSVEVVQVVSAYESTGCVVCKCTGVCL